MRFAISLCLLLLSLPAVAQDTSTVTMPAPQAVWLTDGRGRMIGTCGPPTPDVFGYYTNARPLNIPGQPLGQDTVLSVTCRYDTAQSVAGGTYYGSMIAGTAYSFGPRQDIIPVLGTLVAGYPGSGGAAGVFNGVAENYYGVAFGAELSANCTIEGGCPWTHSAQHEVGGSLTLNAPIGRYDRFISYAAGNSPTIGVTLGGNFINPLQPGGTFFNLGSGVRASTLFDVRCAPGENGCFDHPFLGDGWVIDGAGHSSFATTAAGEVYATNHGGAGTVPACLDPSGKLVRC